MIYLRFPVHRGLGLNLEPEPKFGYRFLDDFLRPALRSFEASLREQSFLPNRRCSNGVAFHHDSSGVASSIRVPRVFRLAGARSALQWRRKNTRGTRMLLTLRLRHRRFSGISDDQFVGAAAYRRSKNRCPLLVRINK